MRAVDERLQAGDRCDVDDTAMLPGEHLAPDRLGEQKSAGEVHVENSMPLVERHPFGQLSPTETRVVDKDVNSPERAQRLIHDALHLVWYRNVAHRAFDAKTSSPHLFQRWRQPFLTTRAEHQASAG